MTVPYLPGTKRGPTPLSATIVDLIEAGGHGQDHCVACHAGNGIARTKFHDIMYRIDQ